jgi:predicted TIM-barrel fold metal-dependent hydrolase
MERIDCHCHVFNILSVGWKAILEQLQETSDLISEEKEAKITKVGQPLAKKQSIIDKLKHLAELAAIFTQDGEKIFSMLDNHYNQQYILSPLMFDGDFLLDSSNNEEKAQLKVLMGTTKDYITKTKNEVQTKSLTTGLKTITEDESIRLLDFLEKIEKSIPNNNIEKGLKKDGFTIQYDEIVKISNNPKYKSRILPYLGVDPRRENIKSYLNQIGHGKLFAGVKVYPPNGFSPMDKVLVGPDSVFEYCSKNQIPIVSHCSYGGFATPATSINVNGYIIPKGKKEPVEYNGTYQFNTSIADGFTVMVQERAGVLNNPKIWRKVLEKYNNLILVLAHFGSGNNDWQDEILAMMKIYPNLYTDVSCMSDESIIQRVKTIYTNNPDISDRILYGSDYFLDMFFNESFDQYLNRIKGIFGPEIFDKISSDNPMKFKSKWYQTVESKVLATES